MGDSEHPLSPPNLTVHQDSNHSRPRSTSIQSRRSWPLLPTLEVTSSNGSNGYQHTNIRSPIIDPDETPSTPTSSDSESSSSSGFGLSDKEKDLGFDDVQGQDHVQDDTVNSEVIRKDSAGTLVEAALDQAEARDRHVRFQDHIAEAGSLVERMLSTTARRPSSHTHTPSTTIDELNEFDLGLLERQQTHQSPISTGSNNVNPPVSGSVLASLMKLESQRRQPTVKRKKTIKRKKVIYIKLECYFCINRIES